MRKNKKNLGFLVIGLGLIILAIVIYLVFFNKPVKEPEIIIDKTPSQGDKLPEIIDNAIDQNISDGNRPREKEYNIEKEEPHIANENDASKLAKHFVERFGTFSNYSNYSNFSDIKLFMTEKMMTWASNYVSELKASSSGSDEYYGVTTKSITTEVKSYDKQKALILVSTQRFESGAIVNEAEAYTQDIMVSLLKKDGVWLVDSAFWQDK